MKTISSAVAAAVGAGALPAIGSVVPAASQGAPSELHSYETSDFDFDLEV